MKFKKFKKFMAIALSASMVFGTAQMPAVSAADFSDVTSSLQMYTGVQQETPVLNYLYYFPDEGKAICNVTRSSVNCKYRFHAVASLWGQTREKTSSPRVYADEFVYDLSNYSNYGGANISLQVQYYIDDYNMSPWSNTMYLTISSASGIYASDISKNVSGSVQTFPLNASGSGLRYVSNNPNISVDGNGNVTVAAGYAGSARIIITNSSNYSKRITVSVSGTPAPTQAPATPTPTQAPAMPTPTKAPATPTPTKAPATPTPTKAPATPTPTQAPATPTPTKAPTTPTPTKAPVTPTPTKAPAAPTPTKTPSASDNNDDNTVIKKDNKIKAYDMNRNATPDERTISLKTSALGGAKLSYQSDNESIKVTSAGMAVIPGGFIGKANITITSDETEVYNMTSRTVTLNVRPNNVKIKSLTTDGDHAVTVKWKKNIGEVKYKLQYSTAPVFTKATTVSKRMTYKKDGYTIKNLEEGQTYYIKMMCYMPVTEDGKIVKYLGKYCDVQKITVK